VSPHTKTLSQNQLLRQNPSAPILNLVTGNDGDTIESVNPFKRARYGESGHGAGIDHHSRTVHRTPGRSWRV